MAIDVLLVNCYSYEFFYIPCGTFEIESHLRSRGLESRILNLSSYKVSDASQRLLQAVEELEPRNVGLILQWKELLNGFVKAGSVLRVAYPALPLIAGGVTASAFADDLLNTYSFLDCVVRGDGELPLEQLLRGVPYGQVANLAYRRNQSVEQNPATYCADHNDVSRLSVGNLGALFDYELYLENIDGRLGLPIPLGRGCSYNCPPCGGGASAFRHHSNRSDVALKDPRRVLSDMVDLHEMFGVETFLLSHRRETLRCALSLVEDCDALRKEVTINLECWDLPDEDLLSSLSRTTRATAEHSPAILLSPESAVEGRRPYVKDRRLSYSDIELDAVIRTSRRLIPEAHVNVFFAYPHLVHNSEKALEEESLSIHGMRERFRKDEPYVQFHMMTLSTDPASIITRAKGVTRKSSFQEINAAILFDRTLSCNMLLHLPPGLSKRELSRFEQIQWLDEFVRVRLPYAYWSLIAGLGVAKFRRVLGEAAPLATYDHAGRVYPIDITPTIMLNYLRVTLGPHIGPKLRDLYAQMLTLLISYEMSQRLSRPREQSQSPLAEYLTLNADKVFVADYNLGNVFKRIEDGLVVTRADLDSVVDQRERTLYLLVPGALSSAMPAATQLDLLTIFDGTCPTGRATSLLAKLTGWTPGDVDNRLSDLAAMQILV